MIAFRKWIDKFTDSGPYGSKFDQAIFGQNVYSKREVLDRYEQHTKHCRFCSGALRNFKILQAVAGAGCLLSLWTRNFVLGVSCLAGVYFAEKWKQKFIYEDHIHAHVD